MLLPFRHGYCERFMDGCYFWPGLHHLCASYVQTPASTGDTKVCKIYRFYHYKQWNQDQIWKPHLGVHKHENLYRSTCPWDTSPLLVHTWLSFWSRDCVALSGIAAIGIPFAYRLKLDICLGLLIRAKKNWLICWMQLMREQQQHNAGDTSAHDPTVHVVWRQSCTAIRATYGQQSPHL